MQENESKLPQSISIGEVPEGIEYSDIEIRQGECLLNSYRIVQKYPMVEIVEGVMLIIYPDHGAEAKHHAWNKLEELHFDVTKERIWAGRSEIEEIKEIIYFPVKACKYSDFQNTKIIVFSSETDNHFRAINKILFEE